MLRMPQKKRAQPERDEQIALFRWAVMHENLYPDLRCMYAVPNGGKRNAREAMFLRMAGVRAGIPDICLPTARHGYAALYIEMKAGKNTLTVEQEAMIEALAECGNKVAVCYSWQEASDFIVWYLSEVSGSERF